MSADDTVAVHDATTIPYGTPDHIGASGPLPTSEPMERLHNLLSAFDDRGEASFSTGVPGGSFTPQCSWRDEMGTHHIKATHVPASTDAALMLLYELVLVEVRTWNR